MMRWITRNPKLARMVGQALFSVGGFVVICGVIGRAGMTALNSARAIGKMPPTLVWQRHSPCTRFGGYRNTSSATPSQH
jgi:hypothetical protein